MTELGAVRREVERHLAVARAQGAATLEHHLAPRQHEVEILRPVVGHAAREHVGLERRGGHGTALELIDRGEESL